MKYKVSKSKIPNADKGLFAKELIKKGEKIGLAHRDGQPVGKLGHMHNHSEEANMHSVKLGNKRYVYAKRDIQPGEELTTNYRMQPELEQPEDFMRKGGRTRGLVPMPKPSKKGLASKKYSRSLEATNRLFAENPLFRKPKSRKNKIYDPNAKYYQDGGPMYSNLPPTYLTALQKFTQPNVSSDYTIEIDPETGEEVPVYRTGYDALNDTITYNPYDEVENVNNPWWNEHEKFHHLQNLAGGLSTSGIVGQRPNPYVASDESIGAYYDRRNSDVNKTIDRMIAQDPNLQFIPREKLAEGAGPGFIGAEELQYADPTTVEGEARQYEGYIEDGNPSIFPKKQNGGTSKTKLTNKEEKQFQKFYKTLPENLQSDDDTYDIRGYWDALGRPEEFDYSQPTESDGYYHAFSINPNTGEYLKSPAHPTFQHAVDEDRKIGYRPITNVYGRNIAVENESIADPEQQTFLRNTEGPANYIELDLSKKDIDKYVKGGYIVEEVDDPSIPTLKRFDEGGGFWDRWFGRGNNNDDDPIQELPETVIYADKKKRKWQQELMAALRAAKKTYQDYTKKHQGREWYLPDADSASGLFDLEWAIQKYKNELAKAQQEVAAQNAEAARLSKKLNTNITVRDLNRKNPEKTKEIIYDALEANRSNMDSRDIADLYNTYNLSDRDPRTIEGRGPNKKFSAKELEQKWMDDVPGFVNKVSTVATALPLVATAGALGGIGGIAKGATDVLTNPVVQAAAIAPAVTEVAMHPQDTITGVITTGVEAFDKLTGDEDDINRFGNPYWQDINHLLNVVMLLPGINTVSKARQFIKTPAGFNFAAKYIKPVKDVYKTGVKTFKKTVDPVLKANIPKTAAAVADIAMGSPGSAMQVVDKVGQVLKNAPAWAEPTVANALKVYTLTNAVTGGVEGAKDIQKGLSEGNKEKFDKGINQATDASINMLSITPVPELYNATTPLTMLSTSNELKETISNEDLPGTLLNTLRLINQTSGLPLSKTQILPTRKIRGFKPLRRKHIEPIIKKEQKGGVVTSLSQKEINNLIKQGYIVEELD